MCIQMKWKYIYIVKYTERTLCRMRTTLLGKRRSIRSYVLCVPTSWTCTHWHNAEPIGKSSREMYELSWVSSFGGEWIVERYLRGENTSAHTKFGTNSNSTKSHSVSVCGFFLVFISIAIPNLFDFIWVLRSSEKFPLFLKYIPQFYHLQIDRSQWNTKHTNKKKI